MDENLPFFMSPCMGEAYREGVDARIVEINNVMEMLQFDPNEIETKDIQISPSFFYLSITWT